VYAAFVAVVALISVLKSPCFFHQTYGCCGTIRKKSRRRRRRRRRRWTRRSRKSVN
jgi:hypothetical protein